MKRIPLVSTALVVLAVAAMIALGVWQLQRRHEKLALIAQLEANRSLPAMALPRFPTDASLFRTASAFCLQPVSWRRDAGRAADGSTGWRQIAECRTGAEGPGFAVQLGIATDPNARPSWSGGKVRGYIAHAPQHRSLIGGLFSREPQEYMLVADQPLPGLKPNQPADSAEIPNNHLAYAVQWFLFAAVAAIVYAVALRQRGRA